MIQNNSHRQPSSSDLPVIHKLLESYKLWHEILPNFPKTSRYSLGGKIDALFLETLELTYGACYQKGRQKLSCIENAGIKLDMLKFFLRVAWDIKALDNKKYTAISARLSEIGRMLGGWSKQVREQLSPNVYK